MTPRLSQMIDHPISTVRLIVARLSFQKRHIPKRTSSLQKRLLGKGAGVPAIHDTTYISPHDQKVIRDPDDSKIPGYITRHTGSVRIKGHMCFSSQDVTDLSRQDSSLHDGHSHTVVHTTPGCLFCKIGLHLRISIQFPCDIPDIQHK